MPLTVNYIKVYQLSIYVLVMPLLSVVYCKHVDLRFILCIVANVLLLFCFSLRL